MPMSRPTEYAMNARPISQPAGFNAMQQPIYSPAPMMGQMAPMTKVLPNDYMRELMRNYSTPTIPRLPQAPDNFTQPIVQPMPQETPLSPYMQQLLQNYRVQNMMAQGMGSPVDYLRTFGIRGPMQAQ